MNRDLSDLDIKAIKFLYGEGLSSGDSYEDAKKKLGIAV
jgi:hypothetical protein